jgi:phosphate transport system substrate-binding protein
MISTKRRGLRFALPLAAAAAALVSACGSSSHSSSSPTTASSGGGSTGGATCSTGSLTGGGSTFVQNLALEWIKNYGNQCHGATINYQGVGSGAGITQLTAGTLNFGATDVPLTTKQSGDLQVKGTTVQLPWATGGIALEYNLSGVSTLKLNADTIAGIFSGKITKWNDPAITALNSGVSLPSTSIATVHRSDSSGTTAAFTLYMSKTASTTWTLGSSKTPTWPTGQGAKGSDGVTATVSQTPGAIGYAEVSYAVGANLPMAEVQNASGAFVSPMTSGAVSATMSTATIAASGAITIDYATSNPAAYPIATPTYVVVFKAQSNSGTGTLLKNFLTYAVGPGQNSAASLYYAAMPQNLVTFAQQQISTITIG